MIALVLSLPLLLQAEPLELDRQAVDAYRRKSYTEASALWVDALQLTSGPKERARLLFNLGNSAYRQEEYTHAVGWYSAAQRLTPRDGDVWQNLELARAEAGLEPADRGDLSDTTKRLIGSLTKEEAEWLLLGSLVLFGVALAGEALRGGRTWRRLAAGGLGLVLVCGLPMAWHATRAERPLMIVQEGGAPARSEPRSDATTLTKLNPGTVVEWQDELSGWVAVESKGRRLWVRQSAVFELDRAEADS